jgi:pteridine reductase
MPKARRVALVTGGAKRVGRAIVRRLAESGFDVAFTYLGSEREAVHLVWALRGKRIKAISFPADLTSPAAPAELADSFREKFDRLDVLVNSASIYDPSPLKTVTSAQMARLGQIHVTAPLLLCQQFAPMLRRTRGHVVNMVDLLAERPWPEFLGYCTTKAGLWNLTLGLARELAPEVTVNGIAPGVVEWPDDYPKEKREKYLKRVPLGRAGTPKDVADVVHFLCTAGTYMTGQIVRLDGGRSIT